MYSYLPFTKRYREGVLRLSRDLDASRRPSEVTALELSVFALDDARRAEALGFVEELPDGAA